MPKGCEVCTLKSIRLVYLDSKFQVEDLVEAPSLPGTLNSYCRVGRGNAEESTAVEASKRGTTPSTSY